MFILGITFKEFIQKGNVILGLVLAVLGLACILLARSIATSIRGTKNIKGNDSIFLGCTIAGLVVLLLGMILIALPL